jgi:serine/threonine protein kinase
MVTCAPLVGSSGSAADTSAEPRTLGKYELVRLLARGGMGEVHLARLPGELGFEKLLVIKTVRTELAADPRFVELFATEAKTAVGLSHPNIAPIYELGRAPDGSLYTAMGWVDGPSLQVLGERLRELGRRLELGAALFIAREILEGLAHAHRPDRERPPIVHRDITPRNVLVDRSGRVQIVDFGIAKPADADASPRSTKTTRAAGSVGYMAPEQARGEAVDPRADVFSVGCVLYELLTNQRAFEREGVWMSPDLSAIPKPLHEPLARALDLDPQRRYGDADGFRRVLAPILAELAPTFGSRELGDVLHDLFPDGAWEDEQRIHGDEGHTPATNVGGRLQTFATRSSVETGPGESRPTTVPDFITGSMPALAPGLREIVDVREPEPEPTDIVLAEPTSPTRRASVWLAVLGIAAIAGLLGYLLAGPTRATGTEKLDAPPPPIRETAPTLPIEAPVESPIDTAKPDTTKPVAPKPVASIELQVSPAQAEVHVDGVRLSGPPYAIELGNNTAVLAVTLDGYHEHLETLDGSAPLGNPLVITLAPLELGSISVLAPNVAWAEVWVDGAMIGTTPLTEKPLREGKYELKVRCTAAVCGEDRWLLERHVRIKPGRTNKFSVD